MSKRQQREPLGLNLPSNNLESTNAVPKVTGRVRTRKGNTTGALANNLRDISTNLVEDIIIPEIKKVVVDFFNSAVESIVYGGSRRGGGSGSLRRDYASYGSNRRTNKRVKTVHNARTNSAMDVTDIIFDSRADAELVLATMYEKIAQYDRVSVGDLYSICGITTLPIHSKYGWIELDTAGIRNTMDGFVFDLPEAIWLDA